MSRKVSIALVTVIVVGVAIAIHATASDAPQKPAPTPRFEYKLVRGWLEVAAAGDPKKQGDAKLTDGLNKFGDEGWEFVTQTTDFIIFKRQK
jgi:hypothetical protein